MEDPNHNLKFRRDGPIQARFTMPLPDPFGGERITIPLGTRDVQEARERRDVAKEALQIAAARVNRAIHRSPGPDDAKNRLLNG